MANKYPNLLDIKKIEDGLGYELIDEVIEDYPELELTPADMLDGREIELTVRTKLPDVQFRKYNEGIELTKGEYTTRLFQCAIISGLCAVDRAIINTSKGGAGERMKEDEARGKYEAAMSKTASQFWYGVGGAQDGGFIGLITQMNAGATHNVDATGSSAKSSVFFASLMPSKIEMLWGGGKVLAVNEEWKEETVVVDGKNLPAYTNLLEGYPCVRLANQNGLVRIKNIGTASGKTLTGDLMQSAYLLCKKLKTNPTHIFMSPRSFKQYWDTFKTDLVPNPVAPTDYMGIPIVVTSNISDNETI